MKGLRKILFAALLACLVPAAALAGKTLDDVQTRDCVVCGVTGNIYGFATSEARKWKGIDVACCRAIAAAVLGDADKIKIVSVEGNERFEALRAGKFDVLQATTTWTFDRDTRWGISFTGVNYYDGQGFMVRKSSGKASPLEFDNPRICIEAETTGVENTPDYFGSHDKTFRPVYVSSTNKLGPAMAAGRCDIATIDQSALFSIRNAMKRPDDYVILPQVISKEPLAGAVRDDDDQWFKIVRWSLYAMINAEELGVDSKNVDEMLMSDNPSIQWLLGRTGDTGSKLGLDNEWAYQIIKQVGNYGEVFEDNLGMNSPLKISRGLNALWKDGGIMYAPPIR